MLIFPDSLKHESSHETNMHTCLSKEPHVAQNNAVQTVLGRQQSVKAAIRPGNYTKTAKNYGPKRTELPLLYVRTLLESLHREPREYRFTMLQTESVPANTPYTKANSFGKFANQTLKRVFGRPLTISGARHSYITHLHASQYWSQLSDAQRESIAKQMDHSYSTACKYRSVMPAAAAPCTQNK
jgi:integrase